MLLIPAVMVKNYGVWGFFAAVAGLLFVTARLNRGAYVSPFLPIERFYYGQMPTETFLALLTAQTVGGYSAYSIADSLWYYSMHYSSDHASFHRQLPCAISYKVGFLGFDGQFPGALLLRVRLRGAGLLPDPAADQPRAREGQALLRAAHVRLLPQLR